MGLQMFAISPRPKLLHFSFCPCQDLKQLLANFELLYDALDWLACLSKRFAFLRKVACMVDREG